MADGFHVPKSEIVSFTVNNYHRKTGHNICGVKLTHFEC